MASRAGIFIDGGYLNGVLRQEFGEPRINYQALTEEARGAIPLFRAYYYYCLPWQSNPPTAEEKERFGRAQRFIHSLDKLSRFQVRLGRLAKRGVDHRGEPIFVQKRVDILLGVDWFCSVRKGLLTMQSCLQGIAISVRP